MENVRVVAPLRPGCRRAARLVGPRPLAAACRESDALRDVESQPRPLPAALRS